MVRKRDLVTAVLITFCLTAMLFSVRFTRSQAPGEYDPWLDINDDGKILIEDVAWVAKAFGTKGDPINKTALLLELQSKVDSLNSTVAALQDRLSILEEKEAGLRTFRLFDPNETYVDALPRPEPNSAVIATFVWVPDNASNNAILEAHVYFEYRGDPGRFWVLIRVNGAEVSPYGGASLLIRNDPTNYVQSIVIPFDIQSNGANGPMWGIGPNQVAYTITVEARYGISEQGRLWARNKNLILTVMDGMPVS